MILSSFDSLSAGFLGAEAEQTREHTTCWGMRTNVMRTNANILPCRAVPAVEKLSVERDRRENFSLILRRFGIRDDPVLHERDQAIEISKETVEFGKGRYIVQLPFRKSYNELSDNYSLAKQRFQNLWRRFAHDSELYQQYREIIRDYTEQDILINFRLNAVAFCSDIKQAFLQICFADEHKDAVRFLWSDDEPCVHKRPKLQVYRDTVELLDRSFYVDDLISGGNEFEEALQTSRRAKNIMEAAGMDLRKWITNDSNLMKQWKKENFNVHPVHETIPTHGTIVLVRKNPADFLSRGLSADSLVSNSRWWTGAEFLSDLEFPKNFQQVVPELDYLTEHEKETVVQERKKLLEADRSEEVVLLNSDSFSILGELYELSNNHFKVINILSYIFRFNYNCRNKSKRVGPLTVAEFKESEIKLIKHAQRSLFDKKEIPSNISNLFSFVDGEGIVRVGGRLENASVPYLHKHPAILPKGSKLIKLYFNSLHTRLFHVGPQILLNSVRQKFWPFSGRSIARKTVHQCVTCFKSRPILSSQIMGNLPSERGRRCRVADLSSHAIEDPPYREGWCKLNLPSLKVLMWSNVGVRREGKDIQMSF
ncbi:integrase catalytic domain-containing protein [Trichonephila clavipes]|nr:integrase catalytic domain-containing protein [Trichonephila clavipes]